METVKDYIDNSATLPLILEWAEEIFGENNFISRFIIRSITLTARETN